MARGSPRARAVPSQHAAERGRNLRLGPSARSGRCRLGKDQGHHPPEGRHFFVRQLRDIKISVLVETFGRAEMNLYAGWCGKALALSHARSGSPATLAGYMGKSDVFDRAIADFSMAYAEQNEKDHTALARAVKSGKVKAVFEEDR